MSLFRSRFQSPFSQSPDQGDESVARDPTRQMHDPEGRQATGNPLHHGPVYSPLDPEGLKIRKLSFWGNNDPETEEEDEWAERQSPTPFILATVILVVASSLLWFMFRWASGGSSSATPPVISADPSPVKVRPENPGGMTIPHQNMLVYGRLRQNPSQPVERLLPPPEQPYPQPVPPSVAPLPSPLENPAVGNGHTGGQPLPPPQGVPYAPAPGYTSGHSPGHTNSQNYAPDPQPYAQPYGGSPQDDSPGNTQGYNQGQPHGNPYAAPAIQGDAPPLAPQAYPPLAVPSPRQPEGHQDAFPPVPQPAQHPVQQEAPAPHRPLKTGATSQISPVEGIKPAGQREEELKEEEDQLFQQGRTELDQLIARENKRENKSARNRPAESRITGTRSAEPGASSTGASPNRLPSGAPLKFLQPVSLNPAKYKVQVASLPSRAMAEQEMKRLRYAYAPYFQNKPWNIQKISLAGGGVTHRLLVGAFPNREIARKYCRTLASTQKIGCQVIAPANE